MADLFACYSADTALYAVPEATEIASFNSFLGKKASQVDAAEKETSCPNLPYI